MAVNKPKLRKHPKRPSKSATLKQKQDYLDKCIAIDQENKRKLTEHAKSSKKEKELDKKIWG